VYVGCLFDSNQNDVTAIPDYEFNSTQASNTYSFLGTGLWESQQTQETMPKSLLLNKIKNPAHKTVLEKVQKL
jgi:hypothetical protein